MVCKKCGNPIDKKKKYCNNICYKTRNEVEEEEKFIIDEDIDNIKYLISLQQANIKQKELAKEIYLKRIDSKATLNLNNNHSVRMMFLRIKNWYLNET